MAASALFLAGVACSSHAQLGGTGGSARHRDSQAQVASQRSQTRWEQVSGRLYDLRV